jgi:malate dehydrogenase (oxaloacetate-decarboxylating)(NADP+)
MMLVMIQRLWMHLHLACAKEDVVYTRAGVDPNKCMPICLDVGTESEALMTDPRYTGLKQKRVRAAAYNSFIDEFMRALMQWRPHMLLQYEDFGNDTAFRCAHDIVVWHL